jgi:soluble lytic murein transglycosylase-like protein
MRIVSLSFTLAFNPAAVRIDALRDAVLSWHIPVPVQSIRGIRLLFDAPRGSGALLAVVRSIVRANPRIAVLDALALAADARDAARREGVDPQFIAATILQESAFDPNAVSGAGAYGIAQFTVPTARAYAIDPFDPPAAIAGAAHVLATYVARYASAHDDPYALALAAYNAGPGAVSYYGGVPPYAETRDYISDIHERWGRLLIEK